MKIKKRIFIYNTSMVLGALIVLLAISGILLNLFENEYLNAETVKGKLEKNVYKVQCLFEQPSESLFNYQTLSENLLEFGYKTYVLKDKDIIYSNVEHGDGELKNHVNSMSFYGDHATVYTWESLTVVGKTFTVDNHIYDILAVHTTKKNLWFEVMHGHFKSFIISYILIGVAAICVIIGISQLFTKRLVKRIMIPVDKMMDAAKRIEDGDLKQPISYAGEDEFEIVCSSFNSMQRHLLEEKDKILKYEKARTDMISGISHDLRTPLTSVKGYIKGIKDGIADTPQKQQIYLDIAYSKACEMDILLQRLFYFSKMETGNMPYLKQEVDLSEFVRMFAEGCKDDLDTKGAKIYIDISKGLHPVNIDKEQMHRVLTNLVENSLKYANVDLLEIKISVTNDNISEIITVLDNGKGMQPDKFPHLFEQFFRADESRSKKNGDGNGLGLYIAKYIVEAHGGKIRAENDNGLKFIITLSKERRDIE
ncbi:MAG: ATP-binding protein [Lachnotalea sp.]